LRKSELPKGFLLFTNQINERFPDLTFNRELEIREVEVKIDPREEYEVIDTGDLLLEKKNSSANPSVDDTEDKI
jgi:hypothetical protein